MRGANMLLWLLSFDLYDTLVAQSEALLEA